MASDSQANEVGVPGKRAGWIALALAVLFSAIATGVRLEFAFGDPEFDKETPHGMLRSDPGLLYYITERIYDPKGADGTMRADPNIRHPETANLLEMFTVGQEYLVAWSYRFFGGDEPLHLFATKLMALIAGLAAGGLVGLAWEMARGRPHALLWTALAGALYVVQPFTYRTAGVMLIREDLSLPLWTLHLWLAARAVRTGGWVSAIGSGVMLAGALATWHAMSMLVTLEAVVAAGWCLRTGESPLMAGRLRWTFVPLVVAGLVVPVLGAKGFLFSPVMGLAAGLCAAAFLADPLRRRIALVSGPVLVVVLGGLLSAGADYDHVGSLVAAKFSSMGVRPDPGEMDFGARLLWQGPFATADWVTLSKGLTTASLIAVLGALLALPGWGKGKGDRALLLLAGLVAATLVSGWFVRRVLVVTAMLSPVLLAGFAARSKHKLSWRAGLGLALFAWQAASFATVVGLQKVDWLYDPRLVPNGDRQARPIETRHLIAALKDLGFEGEPVLTDFALSTALLAGGGHPMVLQPKYETKESRDRIEAFVNAFHHGKPKDVRDLMREWEVELLVVDCAEMFTGHADIAGLTRAQSGGAAEAFFLAADLPAFALVYDTPKRALGGQLPVFRVWKLKR